MQERKRERWENQTSSSLEEKVAMYYAQQSGFSYKGFSFLSHLHVFRAPEDRDTGWHQLPSAIGSQLVPGKQKRQKRQPCSAGSAEPIHTAAAPQINSSSLERVRMSPRVTPNATHQMFFTWAEAPRAVGHRPGISDLIKALLESSIKVINIASVGYKLCSV